MLRLKAIFKRRPRYRKFALLDDQGCCRAFMQCEQPPLGEGWVEVREISVGWIQRPLPAGIRMNLSHTQMTALDKDEAP